MRQFLMDTDIVLIGNRRSKEPLAVAERAQWQHKFSTDDTTPANTQYLIQNKLYLPPSLCNRMRQF